MKTMTETSEAKTAYGKTLETPIKYDYSWDEFESFAEVVTAKEELTAEEVVSFRNTQKKANARQKAYALALDAAGIVKPTPENDPQLRLRKMADLFVSNGMSLAEAKVAASKALSIEWAD